MFIYLYSNLHQTFSNTTHVPFTKLPNHIKLRNTTTEEDIISDITRQNNDGVVEIDDDNDDSHEVPKSLQVRLFKC